jgi:phosphate transport system substrate-binding protein
MKFNRTGTLVMAVALVAALVAPQAAFATTTIKIDGSTTLQPLAQAWAAKYHSLHPSVSVIVAGGGSGVGFSDVNNGNVDIGMSSREPNSGTWETGLVKTRVAKDAVCVAVNPGNPVRRLTPAQIKGIFTRTITNWKQVGGPNAAIVLCGRTGASGTYAFFKEKFLLGSKQSSRTKQYASNGMVRSAVGRMKYAIGYLSVAYVNSTVSGVSVSGVAPTKSNAAAGRYPYVRALYFLTKRTPTGAVGTFIRWCNSGAGQAIAMREYLHR